MALELFAMHNQYRVRHPIYQNDQYLVQCSGGGDIACNCRLSALASGTTKFSHRPTVRDPSRRRSHVLVRQLQYHAESAETLARHASVELGWSLPRLRHMRSRNFC
jgi:hypothetical protein